MVNKYIIIGAKGDVAKKIKEQIYNENIEFFEFDTKDNTEEEIINDIQSLLNTDISTLHNLFILTPPHTHGKYIHTFCKYSNIEKIYCEKPLPYDKYSQRIDKLEESSQNKIKLIDHYLYKNAFTNLKKYYDKNYSTLQEIEINILENKLENRSWMLDKKVFGGVTYDLGHHALAIIAQFIGFENLSKIEEVHINKIKKFPSYSADQCSSFYFFFNSTKFIINLGKNSEDLKSVIFKMTQKEKTFNLKNIEDTEYKNLIEDESKLLSFKNAKIINLLLEKVLKTDESNKRIKKIKNIRNPDFVLESLQNDFLHRHNFFWNSFYKLLFYNLFIITLPFTVYFAGIKVKFELIEVSCFLLSLLILLYMVLYQIKNAVKYLEEEEYRMKIPLNKIREIYLYVYDTDTYPKKKKTIERQGLAGDFMLRNFSLLCFLTSLLTTLFFTFLTLK